MSNIFEQEFEVEGFSLGMFDLFGRQVVPRKIRWAGEEGGARRWWPGAGNYPLPGDTLSATISWCLTVHPSTTFLYLHVPPPSTS